MRHCCRACHRDAALLQSMPSGGATLFAFPKAAAAHYTQGSTESAAAEHAPAVIEEALGCPDALSVSVECINGIHDLNRGVSAVQFCVYNSI